MDKLFWIILLHENMFRKTKEGEKKCLVIFRKKKSFFSSLGCQFSVITCGSGTKEWTNFSILSRKKL